MFAMFIRRKTPAPTRIQGQGISQGYEYQGEGPFLKVFGPILTWYFRGYLYPSFECLYKKKKPQWSYVARSYVKKTEYCLLMMVARIVDK